MNDVPSKMNVKKVVVLAVVLIVAAASVTTLILKKSNGSAYNFITPTVSNIQESVKSSGAVKAATAVDLNFERSGKLARVNVKVGDQVKTGQVLASLESADVAAQLAQAQAAYEAQAAKLESLKKGDRPEDLNVTQTQVDSANKSLADAQTNLNNVKAKADLDLSNLYSKSADALNDAYAKDFDALNIKITDLFSEPQSDSPTFIIQTANSQSASYLAGQMPLAQKDLTAFKQQIDSLGGDTAATDQALVNNLKRLNNASDFLKKISSTLNYAIVSSNFTQANLDFYKSNVSLALGEVNAAASALNGQAQALASQKTLNTNLITQATDSVNAANNNLALATSQLNLKKAGATAEDLSAQQAYVDQARANVDSVAASLGKMTLVSPINGTVSVQNGNVGELTPPSVPIVSLISDAKFQIDIEIAEKDIAKVKVGQNAAVALDAYGNGVTFKATVIAVDPASTIINGVAVYKVTLEFNDQDARLKPGLTANVEITTADKANVLTVPVSALIKDGLNNYVIVNNQSANGEKREVQVGIISADGLAEITSGLNATDKIASFGN